MGEVAFAGLGPVTDALFAAAFARGGAITAKAAAELVGMDPRTLREMTEAGLIRAVPRGTVPAYTEADLRRFLSDGPTWSPKPKEQQPCTLNAPKGRASAKVLPFSARKRGREHLQAS